MKLRHLLLLAATAAAPMGAAQDVPVEEPELEVHDAAAPEHSDVALEQFAWRNRLAIVFADSPNDPSFAEQMEMFESQQHELVERDVIVFVDSDPAARSSLRSELRPRGFALVLIGKDGGVKLRKPFPWSVREITHAIDKWPIRQQELR